VSVPRGNTAWLVTGAGGQLGRELVELLAARRDDDVVAAHRDRVDLADEAGTRTAVRSWLAAATAAGRRPVLINAAAYTAVDAAETDEAAALVVNGAAPGWLAEELAGAGRLVHVSTDYVFGGAVPRGTTPRPYRTDDEPVPRTAYGRTKLAGERAVTAVGGDALVVRTAWVFAAHGRNFLRTMADLATAGEEPVAVVDDQIGTPTYAHDLARGLVAAALSPARGVLHATNGGRTTWWGFAREVFTRLGADVERVVPMDSSRLQRPAPRPAWSVLDPAAWLAASLPALPPWQDGVRRCVDALRAARRV
jgi:dTDP-4-dehydrorhamnose reductase